MSRDERRLARFFAGLAIVIVLTLIHGCISGDLRVRWGPDCVDDGCEIEE